MGIFVGAAQSTFLNFGSLTGVGIGTTTTSGRNAGVNTAIGTLIYNVDDVQIQVYDGNNWIGGLTSPLRATGGTKDTTSRSGFAVHTFTGDGTLVVEAGDTSTAEYIVVAGGGNGGGGVPNNGGGGGGGAGGYRTSTSFPLAPGTYTIQVGGGGGNPSFITNPGITSVSQSRSGRSTSSSRISLWW